MEINRIITPSHQEDIFLQQYRVVEALGGGRFRCEYVEPNEESLRRLAEWGTDADLDYAIARIGESFACKFVSAEQFAAHF